MSAPDGTNIEYALSLARYLKRVRTMLKGFKEVKMKRIPRLDNI